MKIEDMPPQCTTVRLTLKDIFGKSFTVDGKIAKEPYQHGYHLKSGAWALHSGDEPCYKVWFIPKGKRKAVALEVKEITALMVL